MNNYYNTLFPYAYNILGSADEAYDTIQDVLLKYSQKDSAPDNEKNYLIRGVINQSINRKRSIQKTESLDALPQPVSTSYSDVSVEIKDLVSFSLLILLEKLTPKERAVFILKEAFAYSHDEICEVLSISSENARKLLSRAKAKLNQRHSTLKKVSGEQFIKLEAFTQAIQAGNLEQLHQLFHKDIEFRADGGDSIKVVQKYLTGMPEVASLVVDVYQRFQTSYTIRYRFINHQPAILYYDNTVLRVCQVFELHPEDQTIRSINSILDPVKLRKI